MTDLFVVLFSVYTSHSPAKKYYIEKIPKAKKINRELADAMWLWDKNSRQDAAGERRLRKSNKKSWNDQLLSIKQHLGETCSIRCKP